ncbi:hypothetical protein MesoLjLa_68550 (plasmid) [Mesorhizobium sp. L-2-11]|nr:hypothetical protein MesoLjLa_68550 [Mesorhizobium sp. L-2-11]
MIGARMVGDPEIDKDKPAENLDAAFLRSIGGRTEPAREIAVKPVLRPRGVAGLVLGHISMASFLSSP